MNQKNKGKMCSVENCDREAICRGYCTKHYQQMKLRGSIIKKDYVYVEGHCKIIGCNKKSFSKGFCQTHYLENKQNV